MEQSRDVSSSEVAWSYKQKEEDIFYQRSNFFLIAESMLFTAWATLSASSNELRIQGFVIVALGIVLGAVWIYVGSRQLQVISQISRETAELVSVYKKIREERASSLISSTKLLAYFVPVAVIVAWGTLGYTMARC